SILCPYTTLFRSHTHTIHIHWKFLGKTVFACVCVGFKEWFETNGKLLCMHKAERVPGPPLCVCVCVCVCVCMCVCVWATCGFQFLFLDESLFSNLCSRNKVPLVFSE